MKTEDPDARPPRPKLRERQRQHTRDSIVGAAKRLFEERDLGLVTVDDIVSEAGMSRATFYVHYKGKEDVLADVMRLMAQDHQAIMLALGRRGPPSDRDIEAWLQGMIDRYRERPSTVRMSRIATALTPQGALRRSESRDVSLKALARQVPAFDSRDDEARRVAGHLLLYEIEQLCYHLVVTPECFDGDVAMRVAVRRVRAFIDRDGAPE